MEREKKTNREKTNDAQSMNNKNERIIEIAADGDDNRRFSEENKIRVHIYFFHSRFHSFLVWRSVGRLRARKFKGKTKSFGLKRCKFMLNFIVRPIAVIAAVSSFILFLLVSIFAIDKRCERTEKKIARFFHIEIP